MFENNSLPEIFDVPNLHHDSERELETNIPAATANVGPFNLRGSIQSRISISQPQGAIEKSIDSTGLDTTSDAQYVHEPHSDYAGRENLGFCYQDSFAPIPAHILSDFSTSPDKQAECQVSTNNDTHSAYRVKNRRRKRRLTVSSSKSSALGTKSASPPAKKRSQAGQPPQAPDADMKH